MEKYYCADCGAPISAWQYRCNLCRAKYQTQQDYEQRFVHDPGRDNEYINKRKERRKMIEDAENNTPIRKYTEEDYINMILRRANYGKE